MIGLPSLAALDGAAGPRIWLAAEATDMRCCFDRLAERVQAVTGEIADKPTVRHVLRPVLLLFRHCKLEGRDAETAAKSFSIESVLAKGP